MSGGGEFWILMAVVGVGALGWALARSMRQDDEIAAEQRRATDEATRRLYEEEARGAR